MCVQINTREVLGMEEDCVIGERFLVEADEEDMKKDNECLGCTVFMTPEQYEEYTNYQQNKEKAFMFFYEHCNDRKCHISGNKIGSVLGFDVYQSKALADKYWEKKKKQDMQKIVEKWEPVLNGDNKNLSTAIIIESQEKEIGRKCAQCGAPITHEHEPQVCIDCYI